MKRLRTEPTSPPKNNCETLEFIWMIWYCFLDIADSVDSWNLTRRILIYTGIKLRLLSRHLWQRLADDYSSAKIHLRTEVAWNLHLFAMKREKTGNLSTTSCSFHVSGKILLSWVNFFSRMKCETSVFNKDREVEIFPKQIFCFIMTVFWKFKWTLMS